MKVIPVAASLFVLSLFSIYSDALAQSASAPVLRSSKFDAQGRLDIRVTDVGPEGCYLTVNGGLSKGQVDTAIVSTRASTADVAANLVRLRTKRRYYCRKRILFVQVEKVCLGDTIGSALSNIAAVSVPTSNVKK